MKAAPLLYKKGHLARQTSLFLNHNSNDSTKLPAFGLLWPGRNLSEAVQSHRQWHGGDGPTQPVIFRPG
jgi:hypothetical protein